MHFGVRTIEDLSLPLMIPFSVHAEKGERRIRKEEGRDCLSDGKTELMVYFPSMYIIFP